MKPDFQKEQNWLLICCGANNSCSKGKRELAAGEVAVPTQHPAWRSQEERLRGHCHRGGVPKNRVEVNSCSYLDHGEANTRGIVTSQRGLMWLMLRSEESFQTAWFQKIACTSNTGIFVMGLRNRCRVVFAVFL